jgi:hypothetical protein
VRNPRVPIGLLIVLVAALGFGAGSASAHELHAAAADPVERPARGLVYHDLIPAPAGSICEGGFRVDAKGPVVCTHGPDPAPPGLDVREPRSIATLRAATFGTGGKAAAEPSALVPCIGDGTSGNRVQVIYARPADRPSRFTELRSLIGTWAAQASSVFADSAAQTGGSRAIRFVTLPSPDCELVIANVTLSSSGDDSFGNTIDELHAAGYNRSDRKYMVFMDANRLCGIGQIFPDDQPGKSNANNGRPGEPGSIGRTDTGCWGQLGARNSVEAHELVHNLGGVQLSAPNSSGGWHCVDEYDTECYSDEPYFPPMKFLCPSSEEVLLDCNDNDYFNTDPPAGSYLDTHWNVANSVFLTSDGGPTTPANDDFSAAQLLSGTEVVRVGDSSEGATKESGEPAHAGSSGGASIWYSWTAPSSGQAVVDTAGSSYDTLLAVYTGSSLGSLTEIGSNDDVEPGSDTSSRVSFEAVAGQTYKIAVDGFGGAAGTARLQLVAQSPPPANDAFDAAQELPGSDVSREADTNRKATKETGEPAHAGNAGGASVWYRWTAPADGPVVVDTSGSDFDTLLAAYTGSTVSSLVTVASNDDAESSGDLTSEVTFTASAGQTYRIAVDGFKGEGDPAVGTVRLHLRGTEPAPSNDDFASARQLSGSEAFRVGDTNRKATKETGEPAHAGNAGGASVWYRWTAPADGPVVVDTSGSDFDTVLAAYVGGSVASLAEVASNDDVSGLRTSRLSFDADAGVTYRVAVDGYTGSEDVATGAIDLHLTQAETGPANDAFAAAIPLAGSTAFREGDSNAEATKEPGEPNHVGNPGGASVWYRWTAPASGPVTVRTAGSNFDTLLAVYSGGGVASLSPVASDDDVSAGDRTSSVDFVATAGQAFRIAVDGYNGGGGAARGRVAIGVTPGNDQDDTAPAPALLPRTRIFPPQTRIFAGPRARIHARQTTFRFGADQPAGFACRLDSRRWSGCRSPKRFRGLSFGGHVFRVRAIGPSGLVDPSPATRRFRVVR